MHRVEQWRMGAFHCIHQGDDESAAIAVYLETRAKFPDWIIRRITVHEQCQDHPLLRAVSGNPSPR